MDWPETSPQHCPVYRTQVAPELIGVARFECANCHAELVRMRGRGYWWLRLAVCYGAAIVICWTKHLGSFMIFVVSFYALPFFFIWDREISKFFAPTRLERATGAFQTLGLQQSSLKSHS